MTKKKKLLTRQELAQILSDILREVTSDTNMDQKTKMYLLRKVRAIGDLAKIYNDVLTQLDIEELALRIEQLKKEIAGVKNVVNSHMDTHQN